MTGGDAAMAEARDRKERYWGMDSMQKKELIGRKEKLQKEGMWGQDACPFLYNR